MLHNLITLSVCSILSACSQEPVEVVHKGNQVYTQKVAKHNAELYRQPQRQQAEAAPVASVKVAESYAPAPVTVAAMPPVQRPASTQGQEAKFRKVMASLPAPTTQKNKEIIAAIVMPKAQQPVSTQLSHDAPQGEELPFAEMVPKAKPDIVAWHAQQMQVSQQAPQNVREGFIWPVRGKILSTFGNKDNGYFNDGINIGAPVGKQINAVADGEVVYAGNELEGYGNMLIVKHNNGWMSAYAHTGKMHVNLGHQVAQGQPIADIGASGDVDSPQLHFALRKDKQAVNPMDFLSDNLAAAY